MAKRRLTLENFFKGWGLDYSSSNTSAIEAAEQEYSRSVAVDLFRPGKIGHLSPGTAFSLVVDNSSFVNQLPVDAIMKNLTLRHGSKLPRNVPGSIGKWVPRAICGRSAHSRLQRGVGARPRPT